MRRTLIVLAFVAGLVAACSGSAATGGLPAGGSQASQAQVAPGATGSAGTAAASPGGAPMSPVACSLLTSDEAAAALGVPVNPGEGPVDPTENVCTFGGTALADMIKFVEIAVIGPAEFTPARTTIPSVYEKSQATGLGDAAYYVKSYLPNNSGTSMELFVGKGQTDIRIDIVDPGASDSQLMAGEKTLALAALGRM